MTEPENDIVIETIQPNPNIIDLRTTEQIVPEQKFQIPKDIFELAKEAIQNPKEPVAVDTPIVEDAKTTDVKVDPVKVDEPILIKGNPFIDEILDTQTNVDYLDSKGVFDEDTKKHLSELNVPATDLKTLVQGYKGIETENSKLKETVSQTEPFVNLFANIEEKSPLLYTAIQKFISNEDPVSYLKSMATTQIDYTIPFDKQPPEAIVNEYFKNRYDPDEYASIEDYVAELQKTGAYDMAKEKFDMQKKDKFISKDSVSKQQQERIEKFNTSINDSISTLISSNPNMSKNKSELAEVMSKNVLDMFVDQQTGTYKKEAADKVALLLYGESAIKSYQDAYTKQKAQIEEYKAQIEKFVGVHSANTPKPTGAGGGDNKPNEALINQFQEMKEKMGIEYVPIEYRKFLH